MGRKRSPSVWESAELELRVIQSFHHGEAWYYLKGGEGFGKKISHKLHVGTVVADVRDWVSVGRKEAEEMLAEVERHRRDTLSVAPESQAVRARVDPTFSASSVRAL